LIPGTGGLGWAISLLPGSYDLSEAPTIGYRGSWSGAISAGGRVVVTSKENITVTRINYDMMPKTSVSIPTPFPTPTDSPTYLSPVPPQTANGGILPKTSTPWGNFLLSGCFLMYLAAVAWLLLRGFSLMKNKAIENS